MSILNIWSAFWFSIITILLSMILTKPVYGESNKEIIVKLEQSEINMQAEWNKLEEQQKKIHSAADNVRRELCSFGKLDKCIKPLTTVKVVLTSYNPEVGQTDASPCIGAAGVDLCAFKGKHPPIALSQDLVGRKSWKHFNYGDMVRLDSTCDVADGTYTVLDTMNKRFTTAADVFHMDRKDNFGKCHATIYKL